MPARENECPNLNHRRSDAPVRFCPACGKVVNEKIPTKKCTEDEHRKRRLERSTYCVHCGQQLIR